MNIYLISIIIACVLIVLHILFVTGLINRVITNNFSPMAIHVLSTICMITIIFAMRFIYMDFDVWLTLCILSFGVTVNLFVFGAVYKSLSIRLLLMANSFGGKIPYHVLDEKVTSASFLERSNILSSMGLVVQHGDSYFVTQKGLLYSNRIIRFRKLFGIRTTGLY